MSWSTANFMRQLRLVLIVISTLLLHQSVFGQTVILRVDGDIVSAGGDGSGWGADAFKFLQDALTEAEALLDVDPNTPVRLWVAATVPSNPYVPDRDAANPGGTGLRASTFLLNFNNVQILGGFVGNESDPDDRDPALYETVLSGVLQPGCGAPQAGGCFLANGTPACDNAACCEAVCAVDPDCCQVAWDQACADLAFTVCGSCGDPGAGNCFVANGTPGCDDATCCEIVCSVDPDCCNDQWDDLCVFRANLVCGVCGEPDSGSCFEPNDSPGCEDGDCCALVCEVDPACCLDLPGFVWTQTCADIAMDVCSPPTPGDPSKAYHVVTADGVDDSVRIDGFTVTGGLANGSLLIDHLGAGMFIIDGNLAVVRCIFTGNSAPPHGGGGMHIQDASHPLVVNCQFFDNDGAEGGAIHCEFGSAGATLVNCLFIGNIATGNQGDHGGAIDHGITSGLMIVTNCTFTDNTADLEGGAIFLHEGGQAIITNSILWNNSPDEIVENGLDLATVNYSDVQGGWTGNGSNNIDDDPLFVDAANGDYRLTIASLCIDVGDPDDSVIPDDIFDLDNDSFTLEPTPDLDLINRVLDGKNDGTDIVDMGSYEFRHPDVCSCPDSCPADVDGDCVVGVKDLLFLLGSWGPCVEPCPPFCPADFDGTCDVGVLDLLLLLGSWGPCPCNPGAVVLSLQEELDDACLTQENWDDLVAVITDPNASQEDKDRYNCWMTHYLDDCNKCTCVDKGHCPDPDPFE